MQRSQLQRRYKISIVIQQLRMNEYDFLLERFHGSSKPAAKLKAISEIGGPRAVKMIFFVHVR